MRTLDELLADAPTFTGLATGHLELIAGCARNRIYQDGSFLLREGEVDDAFYVVRRGAIALEIAAPDGRDHDRDAGGARRGGVVLGARRPTAPTSMPARVGETHVIEFDGDCLRGKCEEDPALGYELYKRFAAVIVERLQATRLRLLDVYGSVAGA